MIVKTDRPTRSDGQAGHAASMRARVLIIEGRFYEADRRRAGRPARSPTLEAQGVQLRAHHRAGRAGDPAGAGAGGGGGAHSARTPRAASWDGVVALGCVIRGETSHYDIVCNNANHWLMEVAIEHAMPLGNGILTVDTEAQALARARGGADGKGGDAARACLRLIELQRAFEGQSA